MFAANARNAIAAAAQKDMLVDSVARRDGLSVTPVLEADMVGTLRVTIEDPFGLESAAWTSIAPMLAPALATAAHGVDPKDAGVASGTVNPRRRAAGRSARR
jgi:hypothetical protein